MYEYNDNNIKILVETNLGTLSLTYPKYLTIGEITKSLTKKLQLYDFKKPRLISKDIPNFKPNPFQNLHSTILQIGELEEYTFIIQDTY